ncbi:MAG: hypothetical protein ACI9KE_001342 [Polyangiales bacterium]|jgi:hypothetical protein
MAGDSHMGELFGEASNGLPGRRMLRHQPEDRSELTQRHHRATLTKELHKLGAG